MKIKLNDGEWITWKRKGNSLFCCECYLAHELEFRIMKGRIQMRAYRDEKLTKQLRKKDWKVKISER